VMGDDRPDLENGLDRLVDLGLVEAFPAATYRIPELIRLFGAGQSAPDRGTD
jgi:hypothetical protein